MNRMRRMIAFLGLIACLLPLLAGCAGSNLPPPPPPAPIVEAPSAPAPAPEPIIPAPIPLPAQKGIAAGLLLPLSGPQAGLGRALLQAAEMGVFDVARDDFRLIVRDSAAEGGPRNAAAAALADGANIILGPLFGSEIGAVADEARQRGVPVVSFSNDRAGAGAGIYILGVTPEAQVTRVMAFAAAQQLRRFAVLVPDSPYGRLVLGAAQETTIRSGGSVVNITFYDPKSLDLTTPVGEVAAAYKAQGFDALLIPEGGQKLRALAAMLPAFDIPTGVVRLLGTNLWFDAATAGESALMGGWFAAAAPDRWNVFAQRYRQTYGQQPDPRAAIIYDSVTLAVALGQAKPGGDFSQARLTDPSGFAGVTGIFRLKPDGTVERGLAVMEVAPGQLTVKDSAPTSFAAQIN